MSVGERQRRGMGVATSSVERCKGAQLGGGAAPARLRGGTQQTQRHFRQRNWGPATAAEKESEWRATESRSRTARTHARATRHRGYRKSSTTDDATTGSFTHLAHTCVPPHGHTNSAHHARPRNAALAGTGEGSHHRRSLKRAGEHAGDKCVCLTPPASNLNAFLRVARVPRCVAGD
jgi:hypothetical protein